MNSQGSKQLPAGWSWIKLSDISKIFDCKHYTPTYVPKGIPLIRTNDTVPGFFSFGNTVYVSREDYEKLTDVNKPRRTDIVFAREGSFGVASFINDDREYAIGQRTMIIRADQSKIDPIYLTTYINSPPCQEELLKVSMGTTVKRVNVADVKELPIAVPPLAEQKRIAAIAQKADRLRRTRRYALQLSDTYLQSVFLEMFGNPATNAKSWDCATIDDVVALSQYGTSEKSNSEKRGYPILGMGNITYSGHIDLTSVSYVELSEKEFSELKLVPGDIVFNRTNSTELVGKTAHWNYKVDAVLASYLVKLKLKKEVLPDYFAALLNSKYFKQLFQERCKKAIGQSNISPTLLKEFPMLVPPLPLQKKFAQIVQEFERLRTQQREAERQAEHLFQTLLHRAFRGELTPQDSNDEPASVLLEEIGAEQAQAEAEAEAATQAMGDAAEYLGTKAKQQDTEPIQLTIPGIE